MNQNENPQVQYIRSLTQVIVAEDATTPLVLKIATPSVPNGFESSGGPIQNTLKPRKYVLIDALPKDLQERVMTALESLSWG